MDTIKHTVTAVIIFVIGVTLFISFNTNAKESYVSTADQTIYDTSNFAPSNRVSMSARLTNISTLTAFEDVKTVFRSLAGENIDIVGALKATATGSVKLLFAPLIVPYEFGMIIEDFYTWIPEGLIAALWTLMIVYVAFIFISAQLGSKI